MLIAMFGFLQVVWASFMRYLNQLCNFFTNREKLINLQERLQQQRLDSEAAQNEANQRIDELTAKNQQLMREREQIQQFLAVQETLGEGNDANAREYLNIIKSYFAGSVSHVDEQTNKVGLVLDQQSVNSAANQHLKSTSPSNDLQIY
jgi:biopolymer transport protein ExbB/TolQ